jgi:ferritin-like protein
MMIQIEQHVRRLQDTNARLRACIRFYEISGVWSAYLPGLIADRRSHIAQNERIIAYFQRVYGIS